MNLDRTDRVVLALAVGCFILAGLTGAFFRFGMMGLSSWGFKMENIRHAHSHLMYFSWATPALFILVAPKDVWIQRAAISTLILGVISYPFFLMYGYDVVTYGSVSLPPSAIVSGAIMLTWYAFGLRWVLLKKSAGGFGDTLETTSVVFLILSSFGAWGISFAVPLGLANPVWIESFKHLFLGFFTEGWLTLASISIILSRTSRRDILQFSIPPFILGLLVVGISASYVLGMPSELVRESVQWLGKVSAFCMGIAMLWIGVAMWKRTTGWWRLPVAALCAKALSLAIIAPWPGIWWADRHQDRILFLHLLLLGIVSMTIALSAVRNQRAAVPYYLSVCLLLAMLVPVSSFWIFPSIALTWVYLIAGVSLLPVVAAGFIVRDLIRS